MIQEWTERPSLPRVGLVTSGNLASDTIWLLWTRLRANSSIECRLFTDGFIIGDIGTFPSLCGLDILLSDPSIVDQVVLSIRSPGTTELEVVNRCRERGVPSILILADCGSGPQKFRQGDHFVWPDRLCVADSLTLDLFLEAGAPATLLVAAGSPYLDHVAVHRRCGRADGRAPKRLRGYVCDVPNRDDFHTWGMRAPYTEEDVMAGITRAAHLRPDWSFILRRHPKQLIEPSPTSVDFEVESVTDRRPIHEALQEYATCISSYSTALIVATTLGVPSVSFQPHRMTRVREALYRALEIPIASTAEELVELLDALPAPNIAKLRKLLFNPGKSLDCIEDLVIQHLHLGRGSYCITETAGNGS